MRRDYIVTFFDQALTTGANMALQVLLIRTMPLGDYGSFALWQGVSLLLLGIQNALITTPLNVRLGSSAAGDDLFHAANLLMTGGVFIAAFACAIAVGWQGQGIAMASAIAAYLAATLVYQYARSLAFSRLAPLAVVRIDLVFVAVAAAIIGGAVLIEGTASLSLSFAALAVAAGVAGVFGLAGEPGGFRGVPGLGNLRRYGTVWRDSRWALLGVVTYELQSRSYVYIVTVLSGGAAVAELYASQLPLRPANLLYTAWSSLARPQLAAASRDHRSGEFSRIVTTHWAMMAGIVAAYYAALWLAWPWIHRYLYGERYADIAIIVVGWGLGSAVGAIRGVFNTALQAMHEFKRLSYANVGGGVASVAGTVAVAAFAGHAFIPFGVLLGDLVMMGMILRTYRSVRRQARAAPAVN